MNFYDTLDRELMWVRFSDLKDLTYKINEKLKRIEGYNDLYVKDIAFKIYYEDTSNQDYEMMIVLGTDKFDMYDLTIYYCNTRIGEHIIVESAIEVI